MIQSHLYARNEETPVFRNPIADGQPAFLVHKGYWMGVIEVKGIWVNVVTIAGDGWVRSEDTEEKAPSGLHIKLTKEMKVEYSINA